MKLSCLYHHNRGNHNERGVETKVLIFQMFVMQSAPNVPCDSIISPTSGVHEHEGVCVCMCVWMCMGALEPVCSEMSVCGCRVGLSVEVGFLPLSLSVLSLDMGSFTELQLTGSAGLADQQVPGIFLALPPGSVITGTLWSQAFYQALRRKLSS